jgi:serine/threonine-protein kinase
MTDVVPRLADALADRYTIERQIGRGGMATVYLARDLKHDRPVALKVLEPELAATVGHDRFLREIAIAAKLNHPNILGLLDSGEADGLLFYVMPYVDGESLGDRLRREEQLPLENALRITTEVASALHYAHEQGIVHRDIKPGNILLSGDRAVVADFGIAKAVTEAGGEALTETGLAVGTPAYMSPEQATGRERVDGRTDIYSLGCVFYHMVVGEPPFTGPSAQAVLARHAIDPVSPLSTVRSTVPSGIDRVITKAMGKSPADRYRTAAEFADALGRAAAEAERPVRASAGRRIGLALAVTAVVLLVAVGWWATAQRSEPRIERLAVLPPVELATDPERAPVVQGMYDALLTELGQAGVRVIGSMQSMARYQSTTMTAAEIASELGVDAIVESSVFWAGDSVGIGVRLIDGRTEESLWSQSYDADARNVVGLYREVTRAIAGEIQLALTPAAEARLAAVAPVDPAAHEAYLQGRFYSGNLTADDLETAIDYFNLALAHDSLYAPAYAGLSWAWVAKQQMGYVPPREATPIAIQAAERALALDSLLPEAHHAYATAKGWSEWDWALQERGLKRAIALNPFYGDARADYSHYLLVLRRFDEAAAQGDTALASDPFNVRYLGFRAVVHFHMGEYDAGFAALGRVLRVVPKNPVATWILADVYHELGRYDEAMQNAIDAFAAPSMAGLADSLRNDFAARGYREALRAAGDRLGRMAQATFVSPYKVASLYARAGDRDSALAWLERGLAAREPNLPYIGATPSPGIWEFVHDEPRFQALLRAMHLPYAMEQR